MTKVIGITGPNGFVARWLSQRLGREEEVKVLSLERDAWSHPERLEDFVASCTSVVHLAGANRGEDDYVEGTNAELGAMLAQACRATEKTPHVVYASTTQRTADNPYGRGKRHAEEALVESANAGAHGLTTAVIPNVFGAGCRPFYNSVVATFCHQLTHSEQPTIKEDRQVDFLWVGELVESLTQLAMADAPEAPRTVELTGERLAVSDLLATLEGFCEDYFTRQVVPALNTPLQRNLYGTFLSYLDLDDHVHRPTLHSDVRGDLCEVIRTHSGGQVFFSTTKPGVVRGNHYHTRKIEWFCVLRGSARIRVRSIHSQEVRDFDVTGEQPEFISIPVLHTHSIENTGDTELLTMFWCNEHFDPSDADTHFEKVA